MATHVRDLLPEVFSNARRMVQYFGDNDHVLLCRYMLPLFRVPMRWWLKVTVGVSWTSLTSIFVEAYQSSLGNEIKISMRKLPPQTMHNHVLRCAQKRKIITWKGHRLTRAWTHGARYATARPSPAHIVYVTPHPEQGLRTWCTFRHSFTNGTTTRRNLPSAREVVQTNTRCLGKTKSKSKHAQEISEEKKADRK